MKKTYSDYLLTLLFSGLALILLIFFIMPVIGRIKFQAELIGAQNRRYLNDYSKNKSTESVLDQLQEAEDVIKTQSARLITADQAVNFMTQLDGLAEKSGAAITINPDFNGQALTAGIKKAPIAISISGNLSQTLAFIRALEKQQEIFSFEELTINASDTSSTSMSSSLKGQIYLSVSDKLQ